MSFSADVSLHKGGASRVALSGRLDSNTSPDLEQQLQDVLASPPGMVIFDMTDLEYISSAGLRVIFKTRKAVEGNGGETIMVNLQPQVKKVFDIIDALPDVAVFSSYEEMDEYLDVMQQREIDKQKGGG